RAWSGVAALERWREQYGRSARVTLAPAAALHIIGFAILVVIGLWMYRSAKLETRRQVAKLVPYKEFVDQRQEDPAFLLREFYAGPEQILSAAVLIDGEGPTEDVPTVTIFTDFQCPECSCFAQKWQMEYRHQLMGPIRVDLRHLPLSRECNDSVASNLHPEACNASYAAEAARLQGGDEAFWKLHDLLFESTRRLSTKPYAELATRIGLDGEQLLADMRRTSVRQSVARDVALAANLGVRGTPTVFVNGRRVPEFCLHNPVFWEALSADLQQSSWVAAFTRRDGAPESSGHDPTMTMAGTTDR
ncbi:MAG: thioredoxin domain-containing protein, partial [Phycisphaerales bacterium]